MKPHFDAPFATPLNESDRRAEGAAQLCLNGSSGRRLGHVVVDRGGRGVRLALSAGLPLGLSYAPPAVYRLSTQGEAGVGVAREQRAAMPGAELPDRDGVL